MTNKIVKKNKQIDLTIDVIISQEDNYYVAYCPALELSAYADTIENAKKSFEEEVNIFIEETNKKGTLERYLLKNGWCLQSNHYAPPVPDFTTMANIFKSSKETFRQPVSIPAYS